MCCKNYYYKDEKKKTAAITTQKKCRGRASTDTHSIRSWREKSEKSHVALSLRRWCLVNIGDFDNIRSIYIYGELENKEDDDSGVAERKHTKANKNPPLLLWLQLPLHWACFYAGFVVVDRGPLSFDLISRGSFRPRSLLSLLLYVSIEYLVFCSVCRYNENRRYIAGTRSLGFFLALLWATSCM